MTRILDNIEQDWLTTLRGTMQVSQRADFCVGHLNLRGSEYTTGKDTIDLIDKKGAQHFVLDAAELDAICALDQKFRIGTDDD